MKGKWIFSHVLIKEITVHTTVINRCTSQQCKTVFGLKHYSDTLENFLAEMRRSRRPYKGKCSNYTNSDTEKNVFKVLYCPAKHVLGRLVAMHSCSVVTTDLTCDPKKADTALCIWVTLNRFIGTAKAKRSIYNLKVNVFIQLYCSFSDRINHLFQQYYHEDNDEKEAMVIIGITWWSDRYPNPP